MSHTMLVKDMTLRGFLAVLLVLISSGMVILWMLHPPTGDGNAIALLAGFVTLILKVMSDAVGYNYSSSAGSDKKTEAMMTQANTAARVAENVANVAAAPGAPVHPYTTPIPGGT